ncbi:MAG: hypothetical protein U5L45_02955 [Saprospiraceae bacterium]|nr:hypothetical protein [Saprospiraceae bacterium]
MFLKWSNSLVTLASLAKNEPHSLHRASEASVAKELRIINNFYERRPSNRQE